MDTINVHGHIEECRKNVCHYCSHYDAETDSCLPSKDKTIDYACPFVKKKMSHPTSVIQLAEEASELSLAAMQYDHEIRGYDIKDIEALYDEYKKAITEEFCDVCLAASTAGLDMPNVYSSDVNPFLVFFRDLATDSAKLSKAACKYYRSLAGDNPPNDSGYFCEKKLNSAFVQVYADMSYIGFPYDDKVSSSKKHKGVEKFLKDAVCDIDITKLGYDNYTYLITPLNQDVNIEDGVLASGIIPEGQKVLIDTCLINGTTRTGRFIEVRLEGNSLNYQFTDINDSIMSTANEVLKNRKDIVENSFISETAKEIILNNRESNE